MGWGKNAPRGPGYYRAREAVASGLLRAICAQRELDASFGRKRVADLLGVSLSFVNELFKSDACDLPSGRLAEVICRDDIFSPPALAALLNTLCRGRGVVAVLETPAGTDGAPASMQLLDCADAMGKLAERVRADAAPASDGGTRVTTGEVRRQRELAERLAAEAQQLVVALRTREEAGA